MANEEKKSAPIDCIEELVNSSLGIMPEDMMEPDEDIPKSIPKTKSIPKSKEPSMYDPDMAAEILGDSDDFENEDTPPELVADDLDLSADFEDEALAENPEPMLSSEPEPEPKFYLHKYKVHPKSQ